MLTSNSYDAKGEATPSGRVVYLAGFDIDQRGNIGYIARTNARGRIMTYLLFYDQIRLQTSAFFKVPELQWMFWHDQELFLSDEGCPLVCTGAEEGIKSYSEYLNRRLVALRGKNG